VGFRYRKSIKIVPGVRLNLSKSGVSTSIGRRGATVNVGHGRVKTTVGLPGTGMSYSKSTATSARSKNAAAVRQQTARATQPKVPTEDRKVLEAISAANITMLDEIARKGKSEHSLPAAMLAGLIATESNPQWARQMLEWVWAQGHDPADYRLVKTYLTSTRLPVQITPEIEIDEALGRNLIGLMLGEWRQADGDIQGAIDIVEQLEPTPAAALSLSELYFGLGRYADVVELTDGLENGDDVTALLIVYRGVALRELGHHESARLAFKEALRARSRSREVRFRALVERALTYHAEGKLGMARKDLDRIRAEDASYPGLEEALILLGLDAVQPSAQDDIEDAAAPGPATFAANSAVTAPPTGPPANWYADPVRAHTHRYWSGSAWTEHVSDNGVPGVHPMATPLPPPLG
jgi:tetratricopeptide (TPR) repeat protein